MSFVKCRACGEEIKIEAKAKVGYAIVCPACESDFVIVSLDPPEIDWPMIEDDEDFDGEFEDFDDFEDDEFDDFEDFDDETELDDEEEW